MKGFFRNCAGATAIEYAMVAGLISILIITGVTTMGQEVQHMFQLTIAPFL